MWGKTIIDKVDASVANEVDEAFSTKPCHISSHTANNPNGSTCLVWSQVPYGGANPLTPALCQACNRTSFELNSEKIKEEECLPEPKVEADLSPKSDDSTDLGNLMEGELTYGKEEIDDTDMGSLMSKQEKKQSHAQIIRKPLLEAGSVDDKIVEFSDGKEHKEYAEEDAEGHLDAMVESEIYDEGIKHPKPDGPTSTYRRGHQYKCPICQAIFLFQQSRNSYTKKICAGPNKKSQYKKYWEHLRSVHREQSFDCKEESCHYTCLDERLLSLHTLKDHQDQDNGAHVSRSCDICGKDVQMSVLLSHYKEEHHLSPDDGQQFVCRHCGEEFTNRKARDSHVSEVHLKQSFDCNKCGKSFKQNQNLYQHMKMVHMQEDKRQQCNICPFSCKSAEFLRTHVRRKHTGEKPFQCLFCEKTFFSSQEVCHHKTDKHPDSHAADQMRKAWLRKNPTVDPSECKLNCYLCNEVRATTDQLRQHWAEAHPGQTDKPINHRYTDVQAYNHHICEVCGTTFKTRSLLKIHTFEKHEPEGKECPICKEEFPDREATLHHVKMKHKSYGAPSQQKNIVCDICGYVGNSMNLRNHMKTHDASICPTTCTYCGKQFPKYQTMTLHRRKAHPEEWMRDKDRLLREEKSNWHQRKKIKPPSARRATCDICGQTLSTRSQLSSHMKARHGTGLPGYGLNRRGPDGHRFNT